MIFESYLFFFFFNDTATTEIYTLSLHDALPISVRTVEPPVTVRPITETMYWHPVFEHDPAHRWLRERLSTLAMRSEEHTSELQSRQYLVCRLLLEKKKKKNYT